MISRGRRSEGFPCARRFQVGVEASRALGDLSGALETAQRAAANLPKNPWPLTMRTWLTLELGRIEETAELAETLRRRFPGEEAGYLGGIAALRARARLAEALAVARAAAKRFPEQPQFVAQVRELRAVVENRGRALALAERLAAAPPSLTRPRVVVVLGMHRSGTSLAAQTLAQLGIGLGGPLMRANFANADGYFEHLEIYEAHDAALRRMGVSWDACWSAQKKTPRLSAAAYFETRARLTAIVERELAANGGVFAFEPRTLRFLPLWREIFERLGVTPIWLLCVRDPRAVAASLFARDRIPLPIGELMWIEHVAEALSQLGPQLSLILHYERSFEAADAQLAALAGAVGLAPTGVLLKARPALRHQAPTQEAPALPLSLELAQALRDPTSRACRRRRPRCCGGFAALLSLGARELADLGWVSSQSPPIKSRQ